MRLLALGFLVIIAVQAQDTAVWQPAARMLEARTGHCAVGLKDGRILIAGGTGVLGPLSTTEIYGPEDIFQTAPAMAVGRTGHRCTLLEDGRVLVSGGSTISSAEVFDPVAVKWTSVTGITLPRYFPQEWCCSPVGFLQLSRLRQSHLMTQQRIRSAVCQSR
jgi:hypothetical protein